MNESDQPDERPHKLRWFQYSLRGLLLFTLLFAIACSWFTVRMQQAKRQREAVEGIEKLFGSVWYDYEERKVEPPGPAWLRNLLGGDFFSQVVGVNLHSAHVTDADLKYLKGLTQLIRLDLGNHPITDAGLENLEGLTELRVLGLYGTNTHSILK
jgi:hypothetical protein